MPLTKVLLVAPTLAVLSRKLAFRLSFNMETEIVPESINYKHEKIFKLEPKEETLHLNNMNDRSELTTRGCSGKLLSGHTNMAKYERKDDDEDIVRPQCDEHALKTCVDSVVHRALSYTAKLTSEQWKAHQCERTENNHLKVINSEGRSLTRAIVHNCRAQLAKETHRVDAVGDEPDWSDAASSDDGGPALNGATKLDHGARNLVGFKRKYSEAQTKSKREKRAAKKRQKRAESKRSKFEGVCEDRRSAQRDRLESKIPVSTELGEKAARHCVKSEGVREDRRSAKRDRLDSRTTPSTWAKVKDEQGPIQKDDRRTAQRVRLESVPRMAPTVAQHSRLDARKGIWAPCKASSAEMFMVMFLVAIPTTSAEILMPFEDAGVASVVPWFVANSLPNSWAEMLFRQLVKLGLWHVEQIRRSRTFCCRKHRS